MALFDEVLHLVPALRDRVVEGASTADMHAALARMPGDAAVQALREADAVVREAEQLRLLLTGAIASRSTREHGHRGVAQSQGHRSTQSLFQDITGCTRGEASRSVRVGLALWENAGAEEDRDAGNRVSATPGVGGQAAPVSAVIPVTATPPANILIRVLADSATQRMPRVTRTQAPTGHPDRSPGASRVRKAGRVAVTRGIRISAGMPVRSPNPRCRGMRRWTERCGRA